MNKLIIKNNIIINFGILALVTFISSLILIFSFNIFPPRNLETHVPHGVNEILERNYDGPLYVVLSLVGFDAKQLQKINFNGLLPQYYPSHFPLYPLAIRLSAPVFHDYFRAMIFSNWFFSFLAAGFFYLILIKLNIRHPLLLSLLSLFIPPRYLAVRSVGASEGLFLFSLMLTTYFWVRNKYLFSGIFGMILILTRPPGILFFFGFLLVAITQKINWKKVWPISFMPLALIGLFVFYYFQFGDFLIFFHNSSGTNSLLRLVPFSNLVGYNGPVPEGVLYLYVIYGVGLYLLWRQEQTLALLSCVYFLSTFFIKTDDVWRELIPISPFILIVGYQKLLNNRLFLIYFLPILFGIYFYTINLLPNRIFHYDDYARLRLLTERQLSSQKLLLR